MSDIAQKRAFVYDLYPGRGWHKRVDRMPDSQVTAIFLREHNKKAETQSETDLKEDSQDGEEATF